MHTYRKTAQGGGSYLYTVGYFDPGDEARWVALQDFAREGDAAAFAAFMNGGQPPFGVLREMWPDIAWS